VWAVLPIKAFGQSKQRLSGVLDAAERATLAQAMMRDVLRTLTAVPKLSGILVISADPAALAIGASFGARGEPESAPVSYNHAVAQAAVSLRDEGHNDLLLLPGDVPLVGTDDVQAILAAHGAAPAMTIVPDRGRGGTNGLAMSPPDLLAPAFGTDSFARHCDAARAAGVEPRLLALSGLALDIDLPEDLGLLLQRPGTTESGRFLQEINVAARLPGR